MRTFDWVDYLTLAQELGQRPDAAALRSTISRAYYAAYCKARQQLRESGLNVPSNSHKWLWDHYRNSQDPSWRSIGVNGDRLRRSRNRADYDDSFPGLASAVVSSITRAGQVLQTL